MDLIIAYLLIFVVLPIGCYFAHKQSKATQTEDTPEPDYGGEIADTFRTLARKLKGAGELPLYNDALFLASKAEGGELPLYAAAYALQLIAEETTQGEAVRTAAATLYELNEGAGE